MQIEYSQELFAYSPATTVTDEKVKNYLFIYCVEGM